MTAIAPPPPPVAYGTQIPIGPHFSTVLAECDFETYSAAGFHWCGPTLKKPFGYWAGPPGAAQGKKGLGVIGVRVYAEHPTTEVLTFKYDLKDGRGIRGWKPGEPNPQDLFDHIASGKLIEAHNAGFEMTIWDQVCVPKYGWPPVQPKQWRCSAAKSRAFGLPSSLADVGQSLKLDTQKDADGKRLLKLFSWPKDPTKKDPRWRVLPAEEPVDAVKLDDYCETDCEVEALVSARCPDLPPQELDYWLADQAINRRGIGVDMAAVRDCIAVVNEVLVAYDEEMFNLIGLRTSQAKKLVEWLANNGVMGSDGRPVKSLAAEELEFLYEQREHYAYPIGRVLEIRGLTASASVKKVFSMANHASRDARLCDLFIYHGARTGRDTHADVQPGNLPKAGPDLRWCDNQGVCTRPYAKHFDQCPWCGCSAAFSSEESPVEKDKGWCFEGVEHVLEVLQMRSMHALEHFFGDALLCISGVVRSLLVAKEGHRLICSDYASIEAVVSAVLTGEEWRVEAFRDRQDIYLHGAASVTGKTYEWYMQNGGKKHPDRQAYGKPCLGPQTQVLTDRGYLAIVDVLTTDKVWDGVEWVNHEGLLNQGIKEVTRLDGVLITQDHLVNTKGLWRAAKQLVSSQCLLLQALETGSANLPSSGIPSPLQAIEKPSSNVIAVRSPTGSLSLACAKVARLAAILVRRRPRLFTGKCITPTRPICPTTSTADGCLTGSLAPWDGATILGQSSTQVTAGGASTSGTVGIRTAGLFCATFKRYLAGIARNLKWTGATAMGTTNPETCVLLPGRRTASTKERSTIKTRKFSPLKGMSNTLSNVYDLANAGPRRRFTIKTDSGNLLVHNCELGLGFGGFHGALFAFGFEGTEQEARRVVNAWREASPAFVEMWGGQYRGVPWKPTRREFFGLEGCAIQAVLEPGKAFFYRGITYQVLDDVLYCTLLSGRRMAYHQPRLWYGAKRDGWVECYSLTYMTWNTNAKFGAKGWVRMETYSGRLFENIAQATARDIMAHAVVKLERAGYPVVLRVHDEVAAEVPEGFGSLAEFEAILTDLPDWAKGWPIRAAGWEGIRYHKD